MLLEPSSSGVIKPISRSLSRTLALPFSLRPDPHGPNASCSCAGSSPTPIYPSWSPSLWSLWGQASSAWRGASSCGGSSVGGGTSPSSLQPRLCTSQAPSALLLPSSRSTHCQLLDHMLLQSLESVPCLVSFNISQEQCQCDISLKIGSSAQPRLPDR